MKEHQIKTHPDPSWLLSDILSIALTDMESLDIGQWEFDAHDWHFPDEEDGKCHVCLAGAVIAGTIGIGPSEFACPRLLGPWDVTLEVIDDARCGRYVDAYRSLGHYNSILRELGPDRTFDFFQDLSGIRKPDFREFEGIEEAERFIDSMWEIQEELQELEKFYDL